MILPFFFLSKHQNKAKFRNLYGYEVLISDFPGLKTSVASMRINGLYSLNNLRGLYDLYSLISSKKVLLLMVGYPMATKLPILVFFCGMDHQKPKFSLISVPFLLEAVEVGRYYIFENWLMKLKYPNLRISEPPSNKF